MPESANPSASTATADRDARRFDLLEQLVRLRRLRRPVKIALVLFAAIIAVFGLFAFDRVRNAHRVLRGVWLGSLALGGLDQPTVERRIKDLAHRLETRPLTVCVEGRLFELDPRRIDYRIDCSASVRKAFSEGRQGGMSAQLHWWAERWWSLDRIALVGRVDRRALEALFADWETQAIAKLPTPGGIAVEGARPIPVYPELGRLIVRERAFMAVIDALGHPRAALVELPTAVLPSRVTRQDVDRAVERAHGLLSGPVVLSIEQPPSPPTRVEFSPTDLGATLTSKVVDQRLELGFDPSALEPHLVAARTALEREAKDAHFAIEGPDNVRVEPSQVGVRLDAEDVAAALLRAAISSERTAVVPLRLTEPKLSTEQAQALGIRHQVGRFTTHHACCEPRVNNIHRIADLINHTVVPAGETYSVNKAIGPRTLENGFVSAPSIEDGEMVESVGGGISQFATTLFNAVYFAGYDIIERQAHSYWFTRYPMGHEATLGYPEPDLIFKNDSSAGLLIETSYTGTSISVILYGDTGGRRVTVNVSGQHEIVQPPIELEPDPSIPAWRERTRSSGSIGWSVNVTRTVVFADGSKKEEQRKVTYKPRSRLVAVHPCRIPRGEPGYTGETCPVPPDSADAGTTDEAPPH